jgi:hypothetical protein
MKDTCEQKVVHAALEYGEDIRSLDIGSDKSV